MSEAAARRSLSEARVRVTALGFAPGQPYLGELPEAWDIPRQQALTPKVPTISGRVVNMAGLRCAGDLDGDSLGHCTSLAYPVNAHEHYM